MPTEQYSSETIARWSPHKNGAKCSGCGAAPLSDVHQAHLVDLLRAAEHRIARLEGEFDQRVAEAINKYKRYGARGKMLMRPLPAEQPAPEKG
jgi:hypothetical protein